MTIYIQHKDTEDVLFRIEDTVTIPNIGESIMINTTWYIVTERTFYCNVYCNGRYSCTLWVREEQQ